MNRFLGPTEFSYGVKPDRTLRKYKLLRFLRRRFPHLALHPHPAYWEPWLSPKDTPLTYHQIPYFAPGLDFPYVMLKGTARRKAKRIRHPYGVFHTRSWRFEPPLFNVRVSRNIRQKRFPNVFHGHQKEVKRTSSDAQLARALGHQFIPKSDADQGEPSASAENRDSSRIELSDKASQSTVVNKKTNAKSDGQSSDGQDTGYETSDPEKTRSTKRGPGSKPQSRSTSQKARRPAPPGRARSAYLQPGSGDQGPQDKNLNVPGRMANSASSAKMPRGSTNTHPHGTDGDSSATGTTKRGADYQALEAIARKKKQERRAERDAERAIREKEGEEQGYLKHLLKKADKSHRSSRHSEASYSKNQKRKLEHQDYREKGTLTEDELREADRHERKREKQESPAGTGQKRSDFPYGNVPPKFQKTPKPDDRFYWSETGPELRNESNRINPNVLRKNRDDDVGLTAEDAAEERDDVTDRNSSTSKSSKAQSSSNKAKSATSHSRPRDAASREGPASSAATHGSSGKNRLTVPSKNVLPGSGSTVSTAKKSTVTGPQIRQTASAFTAGKSPLKDARQVKSTLDTHAEEAFPQRTSREKKKNRTCRKREDPNAAEDAYLQRLAMGDERTPTDFLNQREELMKIRETVWQQTQAREAQKRKAREAKISADQKKREEKAKAVTRPTVVKEKKPTLQGFLSTGRIPKPTVSMVSKSSAHSLPTPPVVTPVNPFFPKARNRREAFRAYVAKHLLRLKSKLVFDHRMKHALKDPGQDRWGRPTKQNVPLFDSRNPYLVKIIKKLMRTKIGFRYKYESRAEEVLANFPFVEFQTYRKFAVAKMDKDYRQKHYERIKKLYRGQRLFKMATPLRWYKTISKNQVESPFDFQLYSDAVSEFKQLAEAQHTKEAGGDVLESLGQDIGVYEVLCSHLRTPPRKDFQIQLANVNSGAAKNIELSGRDLTDVQARPIAMCVMLSKLTEHLDVSNNLLTPLGTRYIAGICGYTENLSELNATGNQFSPDSVNVLYQCLKRQFCKIRKLWLRGCGMGSESVQTLARIIMENRSLVLLDVGDNNLSNVGNSDMIGLAMAENSVLQYLDLSHNGFSEKASYLIFMGLKASSSLRIFIFSHNHVSDKGCEGVYDALRTTDHLARLDLEHCAITDKGAQSIANGISKNDSLEMLNLRQNPMSATGTTALLKAISPKEKLKNVDLSMCAVNAAFVNAVKADAVQREVYVNHTGDQTAEAGLPNYPIDLDALAAKKSKGKKDAGKDKKK